MHITALRLANFRNYDRLDFQPAEGLNVIVGPNAQGKSALLESIYLLATSKSHRTSRDSEMIRIGEQFARACAEVNRSARTDVTIEIVIQQAEQKTIKINSVKHERVGDVVGQLNAVIFSGADLDMVKGEPSRRRRFLNLEISQVSPRYVYALGRYKRVLDQRNNLLKNIKSGPASSSDLRIWDSQLAGYGAAVMARRIEFVKLVSAAASRIYGLLSGGSEALEVTYKPSLDSGPDADEKLLAERFASALAARVELDVARGTTGVGPHRDDLVFRVDNLPAREFASQGQQRTAAIALKLAEIELIEDYVGEPPVVLLDDVMGELDEIRRAQVLEVTAGRCQTLLTSTHLSDIGEHALGRATVWDVRSGQVSLK